MGVKGGMSTDKVVFNQERTKAIERLIQSGYIQTPKVIRAMKQVPREEFLPQALRERAYIDTPLPIGYGQTISALHMVGMMAEALNLSQGQIVLEVGSGSGYHAAVIAEIVARQAAEPVGHVYTLEIIPELFRFAKANLRKTQYDQRVTSILSDGSLGLPDHAPYDRIYVAAAAPKIPLPLTQQLRQKGLLVIPIGRRHFFQELVRVKKDDEHLIQDSLGGVAFVPLIGKHGWKQ
jgi:protein-L-isoaspartate(D-aspartate) O-methyltransferase